MARENTKGRARARENRQGAHQAYYQNESSGSWGDQPYNGGNGSHHGLQPGLEDVLYRLQSLETVAAGLVEDNREWAAILRDTWTIATEAEIVKVATEANKGYWAKIQALGSGHGGGGATSNNGTGDVQLHRRGIAEAGNATG